MGFLGVILSLILATSTVYGIGSIGDRLRCHSLLSLQKIFRSEKPSKIRAAAAHIFPSLKQSPITKDQVVSIIEEIRFGSETQKTKNLEDLESLTTVGGEFPQEYFEANLKDLILLAQNDPRIQRFFLSLRVSELPTSTNKISNENFRYGFISRQIGVNHYMIPGHFSSSKRMVNRTSSLKSAYIGTRRLEEILYPTLAGTDQTSLIRTPVDALRAFKSAERYSEFISIVPREFIHQHFDRMVAMAGNNPILSDTLHAAHFVSVPEINMTLSVGEYLALDIPMPVIDSP